MFAYANFFTSFLYSFQKQVQKILELYFVTKFLMDSEYAWNILLQFFSKLFSNYFHKVGNFVSQNVKKYTWSEYRSIFEV